MLVALNSAGLMRASTMAKGWRWAVLLAFVFAAVSETRQSTTVAEGATVLGAAWVGLGLSFLVLVRDLEPDGRLVLITVLVTVFVDDTFAYVGGRLAGRHRLAPAISPGKTWEGFVAGIRRVFPDRPIVDLPDTHPIFHSVYDLTERPQIPTWQHLPRGYRNDGRNARWRAILDDEERVMVMIAFNNDIADGWQRADEYEYPQEAANLAISLGVNFAVYALSH